MNAVLGVDLASKRWKDNGTALMKFTQDEWVSCKMNLIDQPNQSLCACTMAGEIDRLAMKHEVFAVCLDGPQGWREPNPDDRQGVGRWCEWLTKTQGKTGIYGTTYPANQMAWIQFSIDVFQHLMSSGHAQLTSDAVKQLDALPKGKYHLLEVFPTATWKYSGLEKLPGKQGCRESQKIQLYKKRLGDAYGMPADLMPQDVGHDDLQAIVSTLSGVGLCSNLANSNAEGKPPTVQNADGQTPQHRCEGFIWVAQPALNASK